MCGYDKKYSEENKRYWIEEKEVEICNPEESSSDEKVDNTAQHEQSTENAAGPAKIIDNRMQFHKNLV